MLWFVRTRRDAIALQPRSGVHAASGAGALRLHPLPARARSDTRARRDRFLPCRPHRHLGIVRVRLVRPSLDAGATARGRALPWRGPAWSGPRRRGRRLARAAVPRPEGRGLRNRREEPPTFRSGGIRAPPPRAAVSPCRRHARPHLRRDVPDGRRLEHLARRPADLDHAPACKTFTTAVWRRPGRGAPSAPRQPGVSDRPGCLGKGRRGRDVRPGARPDAARVWRAHPLSRSVPRRCCNCLAAYSLRAPARFAMPMMPASARPPRSHWSR